MLRRARESYVDSWGNLFVDCAECERGGHGVWVPRCSLGGKVVKPRQKGCFGGTLKSNLVIKKRS